MRTNNLDCAGAMHLPFGAQISLMRKFWCAVCPKSVFCAIDSNSGHPAFLVFAYAEKAADIARNSATLVLGVFRIRNIAQICYSVIRGVAVHVVDLICWPSSIDVKPRKSMRRMQNPIYTKYGISVVPSTSSTVTYVDTRGGSCKAGKHPGFWVIVKQFAQACCGKIGPSHDTVPSLIGQRPARVISTGGLRHFNTRTSSWVAEITKCIPQAANKAAGVRMPAGTCGIPTILGNFLQSTGDMK